eukprot:20884-Heterococcus_DN1.PRE.2
MHKLDGVSLLLDDARVGLLTERHTWHDARAWYSSSSKAARHSTECRMQSICAVDCKKISVLLSGTHGNQYRLLGQHTARHSYISCSTIASLHSSNAHTEHATKRKLILHCTHCSRYTVHVTRYSVYVQTLGEREPAGGSQRATERPLACTARLTDSYRQATLLCLPIGDVTITTGGVSSAYIIKALQGIRSAGTVTITTGGLAVTGDATITTGGVSSAYIITALQGISSAGTVTSQPVALL